MAYNKGSLNVEIDPSLNIIFDEKQGGNSFLAVRKVRWGTNGSFRVDIRKWYTDSEGNEIAGKGVAFMTEEGPANLIQGLLEEGFGDTMKTLKGIQDREDFLPCVKQVLTDRNADLDKVQLPTLDDLDGATFYDPKAILGV